MVHKHRIPLLFALGLLLMAAIQPQTVYSSADKPVYLPLVQTPELVKPVLKWAYGGCYSSWCETGWYSSPAALDLDADGLKEVVASAYSVWALKGETGELLWRSGNTNNRTWPGVAVADIDRDGQDEIVTAQSDNLVSVYRPDGSLKWQKQLANGDGELRGMLLADLQGSHSNLEIVVTRAYGSATNTWVLDSAGNILPGWPQLPKSNGNANGYGWGVYNANPSAGDLDNDGQLELVIPSDVHYINAYKLDGSTIRANNTLYPNKYWGQVGVWESLSTELRGWGECNGTRSESYRANFADGPAVIADVNNDHQREVIVTGNMYDCHAGYPPSRYVAPYIFNADRSRFNQGGYDWTSIPVDTGAPRSEDYNKIESATYNPVVADLDNDGLKEILFASYDGRVHAFWLDKTEHGSWPFAVTRSSESFLRFASEPLVVDLQNDGKAEVIFTSWTQSGSHSYGKLYVVDWMGQPVFETDLPAPRGSSSWNGSMAAPTLANIDNDPDLELIVNTAHSGVVVYDLPNTAKARVLWGTGRGSYLRDGMR
jgi:hypothetical protein